jgi:hypothetical protein
MNYKNLLITFCIFFLISCEQNNPNRNIKDNSSLFKFENFGFSLIYSEKLVNENKITKKIDNRGLYIFHKSLKKNSLVKITNPKNQKTIIAEVISNKAKFSDFYNSVITLRIAEELSLNLDEPYINLISIHQNSTFIAKKAKTFEDEKKVAAKAPVDGIKIVNLSTSNKKKKEAKKSKGFEYFIKIADFYYNDSAKIMRDRILDETNLKKPIIKKLSKTKYRVLLGPYNDIKKLEESFNEIKKLNFENLEFLKNV